MAFLQDVAINTLWYSSTPDEVPDAGDPSASNKGTIAVNTNDGKMWVNVTGGDVTGSWEAVGGGIANPLTVDAGGTGVQTLTQNGVLIGNAVNAVTAVDLSTKGHLLAGDGAGNPRGLAIGSDTHVLTADDNETTGMKWAAAPAAGDIDGSGTASKFAYFTDSDTLASANNNQATPSLFCQILWASSTVYFSGIAAGTGTDLVLDSSSVKTDSSSQRYKENIVNLTLDSARIYNLVPRNFKWRDTQQPVIVGGAVTDTMQTVTGANDFGLIAEEVHAILPELVTYNTSSQPDSVRYKYLAVLLLAELKKLAARVTVLEA